MQGWFCCCCFKLIQKKKKPLNKVVCREIVNSNKLLNITQEKMVVSSLTSQASEWKLTFDFSFTKEVHKSFLCGKLLHERILLMNRCMTLSLPLGFLKKTNSIHISSMTYSVLYRKRVCSRVCSQTGVCRRKYNSNNSSFLFWARQM